VRVRAHEGESQTADAVAASALGPLNPDKWWMHADEHREAAKRERLEIEKSTGKGDCRGAARAPHWPVFIGVITLLQALWHLETLSHRAWIITHRDRLLSPDLPPSRFLLQNTARISSRSCTHRIDFHLLYPCPLYHYQAISVTTLVLHPAILSSPQTRKRRPRFDTLRLASNHRLSTILLAVFLVC